MPPIHLRRKWWTFYLACAFTLLLQVIFLLITWPELRLGLFNVRMASPMSWQDIVLTHVVAAVPGLGLCFYTLFHLSPEISPEGIWRRGFFRSTFIRWEDVTSVSVFSFGAGDVIDLRTQDRNFRVIPGFFHNSQDIISTIKEREHLQ